MKISYRIFGDAGDDDPLPMHGDYLLSQRGRGGYLILGVEDKGLRGGLGEPVYRLVMLTVERVSRAECEANDRRLWSIKWNKRRRRASRRAAA